MTNEHEHDWVETTAPGADYRCRICGEWNENSGPDPADDLYEAIEHGFAIMRIEEDDYVAIKIQDWMESDLLSGLIGQLRDAWPGLRIAVFAGDVEITRISPNE